MFKDSNSSHGILADWDSAGNVQEAENDGHARTVRKVILGYTSPLKR